MAAKDKDLSELTKSIGDIQRSSREREQEVHALKKAAEDRATNAEKQLAEHREKLLVVGYEKKSLEDALEIAKTSCSGNNSLIHSLQKEVADAKVESAQREAALQLEKELRDKAEEKEKDERMERIAISSQMVAVTQEHARSEAQLRESMDSMERRWSEKYALAMEESKQKEEELERCREAITSLEAQQISLKESLENALSDSSKEEEIGRLKGEVNVLKDRLKTEICKQVSAGAVSEEKVRELEELIREGQAERKKMHNIIQGKSALLFLSVLCGSD